MMKNTSYSLAEYKIIENEHGDLWWETHIGLGALKSGKCFINGNILFIKPSDSRTGKKPNIFVRAMLFIIPKQVILNKIITEDKLKTFFDFCYILLMLILRLLFGSFQIIYKAIRAFIGKWSRFR